MAKDSNRDRIRHEKKKRKRSSSKRRNDETIIEKHRDGRKIDVRSNDYKVSHPLHPSNNLSDQVDNSSPSSSSSSVSDLEALTNDSLSSVESRRRKSHRKERKRKERKRKESKNRHSHSRSKSKSKKHSNDDVDPSRRRRKQRNQTEKDKICNKTNGCDNVPSQSQELLNASLEILSLYPDFSSQILSMLRQMSGSGTSFDLGQMADRNLSRLLGNFFSTLVPYGVQKQIPNSSVWLWKANGSSGVKKQWDEFFLIKIIRSLFDQAGLSLEDIQTFQKSPQNNSSSDLEESSKNKESDSLNLPSNLAVDKTVKELQEFTSLLLKSFTNESPAIASDDEAPNLSLANQLSQLCQVLLQGETLSLDGIPNQELRMGLQILFTRTGLDYYEMESESEDEGANADTSEKKIHETSGSNDKKGQTGTKQHMGFGLPESNNETKMNTIEGIKNNLGAIIQSCKSFSIPEAHQTFGPSIVKKTIMKGPSFLPTTNGIRVPNGPDPVIDCSESSDDDGPAPAGSVLAKKRSEIGPRLPSQIVKAMVAQRTKDLLCAKENGNINEDTSSKGQKSSLREEWMMNPGEHDFLQGIVKSGNAMKNRKFKNEKNRGSLVGRNSKQIENEPLVISTRLQKELDDVIKAHTAARGPSLIEEHRRKKAEEKFKIGGEKEWNWSKKDLDAGRRVDKKALGEILGGAAKGLTDKFQGSVAKGFM